MSLTTFINSRKLRLSCAETLTRRRCQECLTYAIEQVDYSEDDYLTRGVQIFRDDVVIQCHRQQEQVGDAPAAGSRPVLQRAGDLSREECTHPAEETLRDQGDARRAQGCHSSCHAADAITSKGVHAQGTRPCARCRAEADSSTCEGSGGLA